MEFLKAFKTELDVTPAQDQLLRKYAGAKRFVYNWMLAQCQFAKESGKKKPSSYDLIKKFRSEAKPTLEWYSEISSKIEESAARDLDAAFKNFFRRIRQGKVGKKAGYPKFKKKRTGVGSFTTFGLIRADDRTITIQKIGKLNLKERGYIPTDKHFLNATISTRGGRWFISCLCNVEIDQIQNKRDVVGVDLGIKHAATLSDGTVFDSPMPLKSSLRKLRKLNKAYSRTKIGSNRRYKATLKLGKLHARIANIRSSFIHNFTTQLARTKQVVVIEDLSVSGMVKNHHLAWAISDIGFYEIRRQLEYKMKWYGGELIVASRWYPSSKTCHVCGFHYADLKLSERDWTCPQCGTLLDRDVNAAINLAKLAVKTTESLNGRRDGSSVECVSGSAQPVDEASIHANAWTIETRATTCIV